MSTFTPPTLNLTPPVPVADTRHGPSSQRENPQGYRLMRYFPSRAKGLNVWKMSDGTYWMSQPVDGVNFTGTYGEPYPDTPDPVNDAISSAWYPGGPGGAGASGPGGDIEYVSPTVAVTYYGGHSYSITSAEAAALTAVGLGAYIT